MDFGSPLGTWQYSWHMAVHLAHGSAFGTWQCHMKKISYSNVLNFFFPSEIRGGLCGRPVPTNENICNPMNNLPTLHLYSHVFDTSKNIAYQLGSRIRTMSGKTSKEEKALEKRIKNDAKERPRKKCDHCKKDYCGYTYLFSHVKNNEACRSYYKHARKWEKLEEEKKKETKSYQKSKAKSEAENALEEAKKTFTFKFKQVFKHAINQVKVSGHGATVSTYFFIILQKL